MLTKNTNTEINIRIIPLTTDENLPLATYIEQMKTQYIRLDHPLQRYALQWEKERKSNLVRRVVQGGKFAPLLICTQLDANGCEVYWLIDGKQRLTSLQEFIEGKFFIHPKTRDYMVTYDGILYEKKTNKSGKFGLKKNNKGSLIPILDEEGREQKIRQTIDIRGLGFKDLPPELQTKIKNYMVPAQIKHKCTDDDIKLEILDYNSGSPMNVAQIGKSSLGKEMATINQEFAEHRFVLDKCGFTTTNKIKGVTERSIGEALGLVTFGAEGWIKDYKELCLKMSDCIDDQDIEWFRTLLDRLDQATTRTEELEKHMVNKEFFIVVANFAYFMEKNYKLDCYGQFLQKFVSDIKYRKVINTNELDDEGNEIYDSYVSVYEKSTKNKNVVEARLFQMNEMLDQYLAENCEGMIEEDEEVEFQNLDVDMIKNFVDEFNTINIPKKEGAAIESLMLCSDYPMMRFDEEGFSRFLTWTKNNITAKDCEDCITYTESLFDWLERCNYNSELIKNNLPFFVAIVKGMYLSDDIDDDMFVAWLESVSEEYISGNDLYDFDKENNSTLYATIITKINMLNQSLLKYIGGEKDEESI